MYILADDALRNSLKSAFPESLLNMNNELIVHPKYYTSFRLADVSTELELKCKVLEWCSREANKSIYKKSKKYHFDGINKFFGKSFSEDDMEIIYTRLGNNVNRALAIKFIESGLDISVLAYDQEGH